MSNVIILDRNATPLECCQPGDVYVRETEPGEWYVERWDGKKSSPVEEWRYDSREVAVAVAEAASLRK